MRCLLAVALAAALARAGDGERAFKLAGESKSALKRDGTLALLLAREAMLAKDTVETRTALYDALVNCRERAILRGHEGAVLWVDLSADGARVATASADGTARLWKATGEPLAVLPHPHVRSAHFLGDNVLTAGEELRFWDLEGKQLASVPGRASVSPARDGVLTFPAKGKAALWGRDGKLMKEFEASAAGFSPAGGLLHVVAPDGKVTLHDLKGRRKAALRTGAPVRSVAFAGDGNSLLTFGGEPEAVLWSLRGNKLAEFPHRKPLQDAFISADGKRVLTSCDDDTLALWDATGRRLHVMNKRGRLIWAGFSPEAGVCHTITDGNRGTIWIEESNGVVVETKKLPERVREVDANHFCDRFIVRYSNGEHGYILVDLEVLATDALKNKPVFTAWSPKGDWLLIGNERRNATLIHSYGQKALRLRGHAGGITHGCWSKSGDILATASRDKTARLWAIRPEGTRPLPWHPHHVWGGWFPPGSNRAATLSWAQLRIWDLDGNEVAAIEHSNVIEWWAPSGRLSVILVTDEPAARLYDPDGKLVGQIEHREGADRAWGSAKGDRTITWSTSGRTIWIWDARGRLKKRLEHDRPVEFACLSENARSVFSCDADGLARLWTAGGRQRKAWAIPKGVSRGFFSPRGDRLLTMAKDAKSVELWNDSGERIAVLAGHKRPVTSFLWSRAGDAIVTASRDRTARLWDAAGRELHTLRHPDEVRCAGFTPDGAVVFTGCQDGSAHLFDRAGKPLATLHGHSAAIGYVACSEKSDRLLTCSEDSSARFWPIRPEELLALADRSACRGFLEAERERFGELLPK